MKKKLLSLCLVLVLLAGLIPASFAEDSVTLIKPVFEEVTSGEKATLPFHVHSAQSSLSIEVLFLNGETGIPFVNAQTICDMMGAIYQFEDMESMTLTAEQEGDVVIFTRENGSSAFLDLESKVLFFTDYDLFVATPIAVNGLDVVWTGSADEHAYLIGHKAISYRNGENVSFDLSDYEIPVVEWEGVVYLPLQTASDLFFASVGDPTLYNGERVMVISSGVITEGEESDLYYSAPDRTKSQAMVQFTYNELCLALDAHYGLKDEHEITDFDALFLETGLAEQLYSQDSDDTYRGLFTLTMALFNDGHSAVTAAAKSTEIPMKYEETFSSVFLFLKTYVAMAKYKNARNTYYPDGAVGYEEVGNTAYITFDAFTLDTTKDYYNIELTNTTTDTVELLLYAHQQITREDSPIRNVVVDLTNNLGGAADAAMCLVSWILGQSTLNLQDMLNHAQASTMYAFDGNLDRIYDSETDSVSNLRCFCLISPVSFSCGNLVPSAFKASDSVTLIGRPTSGGACIVQPLTTADGCMFQISGRLRVNTRQNGSYQSVDTGVEPDIYITNIENLYDRESLTDYLNSLY